MFTFLLFVATAFATKLTDKQTQLDTDSEWGECLSECKGLFRNGVCDTQCNNAVCYFDGGDCGLPDRYKDDSNDAEDASWFVDDEGTGEGEDMDPEFDEDWGTENEDGEGAEDEDYEEFEDGEYEDDDVEDCSEGCPAGWIGDGQCDAECNVAPCNFDDGDCDGGNGEFDDEDADGGDDEDDEDDEEMDEEDDEEFDDEEEMDMEDDEDADGEDDEEEMDGDGEDDEEFDEDADATELDAGEDFDSTDNFLP